MKKLLALAGILVTALAIAGGDFIFVKTGSTPFSNTKSLNISTNDEYYSGGNIADLNFEYTDNFSWSAWFKYSTVGKVVAKETGSGTFRGWAFDADSGRIGAYLIADLSGSPKYTRARTAAASITTNTWYHIVFVKSGATGDTSNQKIYINGSDMALSHESNTIGSNSIAGTANFMVGRYDGGGGFVGFIDEVSFWSDDLTAGEVTAIYNSGDPTDLSLASNYASECLHWYRMGDLDDSTTTIKDRKGSADLTGTNIDAGDLQTDVP